MREQRGFDQSTPTITRRPGRQRAPSTGHYVGLHPDDMPSTRTDAFSQDTRYEYDFMQEPRTNASSTRRYMQPATPRTVIRVTTHPQPIQRASRMQPTRTEVPQPVVRTQPAPVARHWLFYVGIVLFLMLVGWILFTVISNWWNGLEDDWHYGKPRTAQYDENVGHGGMSHFTVENLQGHIIILEVVVSNPSHAKIYVGPVLSGSTADLAPATLSFEDVNGDTLPDMVLTVDNTKHTFLNSKDGSFHVMNAGGNG